MSLTRLISSPIYQKLLPTRRVISCPHYIKRCYLPEAMQAVTITLKVATYQKRYQLSPLYQALLPTRSGASCHHYIKIFYQPEEVPALPHYRNNCYQPEEVPALPHYRNSCYQPEAVQAVTIISQFSTNQKKYQLSPITGIVAANHKWYQLSSVLSTLLPVRIGFNSPLQIKRWYQSQTMPIVTITSNGLTIQMWYQLFQLHQNLLPTKAVSSSTITWNFANNQSGTNCTYYIKGCYQLEEVPDLPITLNIVANQKRYQLLPSYQMLLLSRNGTIPPN